MKHVGLQIAYEDIQYNTRFCPIKRTYDEWNVVDKGDYKVFYSTRALKSGCNKSIIKDGGYKSMQFKGDTLLYCPHCDEWFNEGQFDECND